MSDEGLYGAPLGRDGAVKLCKAWGEGLHRLPCIQVENLHCMLAAVLPDLASALAHASAVADAQQRRHRRVCPQQETAEQRRWAERKHMAKEAENRRRAQGLERELPSLSTDTRGSSARDPQPPGKMDHATVAAYQAGG